MSDESVKNIPPSIDQLREESDSASRREYRWAGTQVVALIICLGAILVTLSIVPSTEQWLAWWAVALFTLFALAAGVMTWLAGRDSRKASDAYGSAERARD